MRSELTIGIAVGALLTSGCAGSEEAEVTYSAPDGWSAEVVVLTGDQVRGAPELTLTEEVRVGTLDGPEELQHFRVSDAAIREDELWVLDGGDAEVRVYGLDGAYRRTLGRRGEGPGELQSPTRLTFRGDTVVLAGFARLTLFSTEGEVVGTGPGRLSTPLGTSTFIESAGPHWVRRRSPRRTEMPQFNVLERDTSYLHAADPMSEEFGPQILEYPTALRMLAGEIGFFLNPFFGARPFAVPGDDGHIYFTPQDEYRIDILDAGTGAPVRRIVSTMALAPVTQEMIDVAWAREQERLKDPPPGSEAAMLAPVIGKRLELPVPEARPVVGAIEVAASGAFLIERDDLDPDPNEPGDATTWDLFSSDGSLEGRFVLPPGTRVLRFTGDRVIALETDDLDVPYVVVYRMAIR